MENNQSNTAIWIIVAVLIVIGTIAWFTLNSNPVAEDAMTTENGAMMEKEDSLDGAAMMEKEVDQVEGAMMEKETPEGAMMEKDESEGAMMEESGAMMESKGETIVKAAGTYEAYDEAKLAKANQGDVVLFFHATWCPTCRAADTSINTTGVPDGLTILKLNYDTATDLRKKYGVTTQHSFVQVDANGELIKKWTGSASAAAIAAQTI